MYVFGPSILIDYGSAAKFDLILSIDYTQPPALHPGPIQGKEGIKFGHLEETLMKIGQTKLD